MTVGQRIHMRRKELNLTMKTIFERENIKTGNLSELENDKYLPSVQTLVSLARVLDCSIDWLLTGKEYTPDTLNSEVEHSSLGDCDPLEGEEADLLAMFRRLPDSKKEDAFDIICTLYQKHVEQKKESIYWTYKADKLKRKCTAADSDETMGGTA